MRQVYDIHGIAQSLYGLCDAEFQCIDACETKMV